MITAKSKDFAYWNIDCATPGLFFSKVVRGGEYRLSLMLSYHGWNAVSVWLYMELAITASNFSGSRPAGNGREPSVRLLETSRSLIKSRKRQVYSPKQPLVPIQMQNAFCITLFDIPSKPIDRNRLQRPFNFADGRTAIGRWRADENSNSSDSLCQVKSELIHLILRVFRVTTSVPLHTVH